MAFKQMIKTAKEIDKAKRVARALKREVLYSATFNVKHRTMSEVYDYAKYITRRSGS
jgi:hypothetical protein